MISELTEIGGYVHNDHYVTRLSPRGSSDLRKVFVHSDWNALTQSQVWHSFQNNKEKKLKNNKTMMKNKPPFFPQSKMNLYQNKLL